MLIYNIKYIKLNIDNTKTNKKREVKKNLIANQ